MTVLTPPIPHLSQVPFVWKGRTKIGCDCLGFASLVASEVHGRNFRLWDDLLSDYYDRHPEAPDQETEILGLAKQLIDPREGKPVHGDLLVVMAARQQCLGTYLERDGQGYLAAMFRSGSRVVPFRRFSAGSIVGVFDVGRLLA